MKNKIIRKFKQRTTCACDAEICNSLIIKILKAFLFLIFTAGFSGAVNAEVVKLKCVYGGTARSPKTTTLFQIVDSSRGTISGESYGIVDISRDLIVWQKNPQASSNDQLPFIEINRKSGVLKATWSDGVSENLAMCTEF